MFSSQRSNLSKEAIASRMFRNAARFWGLNDTNMDNFDPLVRLLIEACAVELYRVDNEMVNLQKSMTQRLAGLLIPEVYLQPKPAHGILHATSEDDYTYISEDVQFLNKKKVASVENGPLDSTLDVFFAPSGKFKTVNSDVKYIAAADSIYKINDLQQKETFMKTRSSFKPQTMWIGLDVEAGADLTDVALFFDLKNTPDKARYLSMLSHVRCEYKGTEVVLKKGLPQGSIDKNADSFESHLEELYLNRRLEKMTNRIYSKHFMSIAENDPSMKHISSEGLVYYPAEFSNILHESDLEQFDTEMLWLQMHFPPEFDYQIIDDVTVAINCFPVSNRHLNKTTYRLNSYFNIIPLLSDEQFFAVNKVEGTFTTSSGTTEYVYYPFDNFNDDEKGNYTVRFGDLQRFDNRNAAEYLNYFVELLRDESRAFAAFGQDFLESTIKELNQNIGLIEKRIKQNMILLQTAPTYLLISPLQDSDIVFVQFWTCNGAAGNGIRSGSIVDLYEGVGFRKKSLVLMTQTHGGMDKLKNTEILTAFKSVLLSRNRIVTEADIIAYCTSFLHDKVREVTVERAAAVSPKPNQGLMPVVKVTITPSNTSTEVDWEGVKTELHEELTNLSAVDMNYLIEVS